MEIATDEGKVKVDIHYGVRTLDDVKVGDLVLRDFSRCDPQPVKVVRTTATQIIINEKLDQRYRRKDGKRVGKKGPKTKDRIRVMDWDEINALKHKREEQARINKLKQALFQWLGSTRPTLRQLENLVVIIKSSGLVSKDFRNL